MQSKQDAVMTALPEVDLTPEQQKKIAEIVTNININDSQAILQYGVGMQKRISDFSDILLDQIKSKDSGYAGEILCELMQEMKSIDVNSINPQPDGFFGRLFHSHENRMERFIDCYENVSVQIEKIMQSLDVAKMRMLKDITLLDGMYEKNKDYVQNLELYILAGARKLEEINHTLLPDLKKQTEKSDDPLLAQKYQDMLGLVHRFEKKLYDLKLSRMISIQTAPQIRLIQNNDQVLVEKIQTSVLNTIPMWKNQLVIAISIFRQQHALTMQKKVTETNNEVFARGSELLRKNTVGAEKASERGIAELETLKQMHNDLLATIEETLRIQDEGHAKRMQAETALSEMEAQMKARLSAIGQRSDHTQQENVL